MPGPQRVLTRVRLWVRARDAATVRVTATSRVTATVRVTIGGMGIIKGLVGVSVSDTLQTALQRVV